MWGLRGLGIKEISLKEVALAGASGQAESTRCQGGPGEGQHGVGRKKRGGVSSENSQRAERMKTCSWQPTIGKKTLTGLSSFPSPKNRSRERFTTGSRRPKSAKIESSKPMAVYVQCDK